MTLGPANPWTASPSVRRDPTPGRRWSLVQCVPLRASRSWDMAMRYALAEQLRWTPEAYITVTPVRVTPTGRLTVRVNCSTFAQCVECDSPVDRCRCDR